MGLIVTNFATTTMATATINPLATSLVVDANTGNLFPTLSPGDYTYITMVDSLVAPTKREIMKVTARVNDTFTVERAADGTIAQTWVAGNYVILRWCRAMIEDLIALLGGPYVESVTGLNTDNSDPVNPVVRVSVDGVTITGAGTPGDPLVSAGGGGLTGAFLDLGPGTSFNIDWSLADWFKIAPSGDFTISFTNTPAADECKSITIEIVAANGLTLTLPAGGTWGALGEPEWAGTGNDLVTVGMRDGSSDSFWMLAHPGDV